MTSSRLPECPPAEMTEEQRRKEIAAVLARGVLRLRRLPTQKPAEKSAAAPLDVPAETVLSVHTG